MEIIKGYIDTFIYYNEDTGYGIFYLEDGTKAVGIIPRLNPGQRIELKGNWNSHLKFGKQFNLESFNILYPETVSEIIKFLSSGIIKGVGEKTALKIVRKFGDQTFDILDNKIELLYEIKGFGKSKVALIQKSWKEQKGIKDIIIFLRSHGISTTLTMKIYKTYGNQAKIVIKNNPYQLTYDIAGIGFKLADKIALNAGINNNHPNRIKAGILHILNEAAHNGHVYLPEIQLIRKCELLLNYEMSRSEKCITDMESEGRIKIIDGNLYLSYLLEAEIEIEKRIRVLTAHHKSIDKNTFRWLKKIQSEFSAEQLEAVKKSVEQNLFVLTGGPGTGKTETLKGIIHIYEKMKKKFLLAAPTGRAAKKMSEVINREAKTIHRLLEYNPIEKFFNFNEGHKLDTDLLIIDEVSMMDTILMYHLLEAISDNTTLILVGDSDQLPSVGPGSVLADLIKSGIIPFCILTKIFRQAEQSKIILAAHQINMGEVPELTNDKNSDLFFIEQNNEEQIPKIILDLCVRRLPKKYNYDPMTEIQVLSPMHRGVLGTVNLNKVLQSGLNSRNILLKRGGYEFRVGDKVMQLRNNYEKEIFNGDLGLVIGKYNTDNSLVVNIDNKEIKYDVTELDELTLAYAITVHKSQGSEYPCIILPLFTSHFIMLQRNLLYTAITRAKELMIIIGNRKALKLAIQNNRVVERYTSLFKKDNLSE